MGFTLAANATICNDARWLNLSSNRATGNWMDQYMLMSRVACTNIRLLYVNNTNASITFKASACKGWRTSGNLPVAVTVGGSDTITIPAWESVLSDELANVASLAAKDLVLHRAFKAAAGNIASGVQASITFNAVGTNVVPVNAFGQRATNYRSVVADESALFAADDTYEQSFANTGGIHQSGLLTPFAMIGIPTDANAPRLAILCGDSKTTNNQAAGDNESASFGAFQPVVFGNAANPTRAYLSFCIPGQSATAILSPGNTAQQTLMKSVLSIPSGHDKQPIYIHRFGTNSLGNTSVISTGVANELGYIQQILSLMKAGTKCVVSTCDPVAALLSGSWATVTEEQQANGGNFSNGIDMMNTYNALLRDSKPSYINRVADCASVVTTSSGKWLANMTSDGIHQTAPASLLQAPLLRDQVNLVQQDYDVGFGMFPITRCIIA